MIPWLTCDKLKAWSRNFSQPIGETIISSGDKNFVFVSPKTGDAIL